MKRNGKYVCTEKSQLNREKIGKIQKKSKLNSEKNREKSTGK
jgi:hypothetical protein